MIPTFKTLHIGGVERGRENIKRGYLIQKKDFRRLGEILHLITFFFLMHILLLGQRELKQMEPIMNFQVPTGDFKVQRVDLTCDVIRKVAPFVLSKL